MASIFKPAGSRKWVILYHDENGKRRKKTGATDKAVTERLARDIENRVLLRREGVVDPKAEAYRDHEATPFRVHLAEWIRTLEARGATPKHTKLFTDRAARVVALIKGASLAEIDPPKKAKREDVARVEANLTRWTAAARLSDLTAERVQSALASLKIEGRSLATCNHYRAAVRAFSRWCHETHRTREDALRGVKGYNAKEDRRHDRRTLSLDELHRLIQAAEQGRVVFGLTGPARALCYRLAASTGLRYSEIASIRPGSFDWEAPSVTIPAAYTKNGDPATLPLPGDLASELAAHVATLGSESRVFRLPKDKGAKILQADLAAAGIPYKDESGLFFDFHALRCQTATLADAAGVSPRVVQKLMRHSTLELTGRYTRPRAVDVDAAASMLPSLKPAADMPGALAATGTDPSPVPDSTATENATEPLGDGRNANSAIGLAETRLRSHNPQVRRSSRLPGINARTGTNAHGSAATPCPTVTSASPFPSPKGPPSRRDAPGRVYDSTPGATGNATEVLPGMLPADPGLAEVVDAWKRLPASVREGIVAAVRTALARGP